MDRREGIAIDMSSEISFQLGLLQGEFGNLFDLYPDNFNKIMNKLGEELAKKGYRKLPQSKGGLLTAELARDLVTYDEMVLLGQSTLISEVVGSIQKRTAIAQKDLGDERLDKELYNVVHSRTKKEAYEKVVKLWQSLKSNQEVKNGTD